MFKDEANDWEKDYVKMTDEKIKSKIDISKENYDQI